MNKHKTLKFIFSVILLIFIMPILSVEASNRYYEVNEFNITVDILENGDAVVMEEITYDFDGDFNGILRDIDYDRTSGIKDITVGVLENGNIVSFEESGGSGRYVYEREDIGSEAQLRIYEQSSNEEKTFYIGYTLVNVAEKYNDIGIFNRRIVDSGWDIPLNNINITITIPEGAAREDLRVFAHGPLTCLLYTSDAADE